MKYQMRIKTKTDKGVAGLTILLSLVTMLFVIGLLVMIFSLMGGGLRDATYDDTTVAVANETITFVAINTPQTLSASTQRDVVCSTTPTSVWNETLAGVSIPVTNVTLTADCTVVNATTLVPHMVNGTVFVSYNYNWDADNTATDIMNDTTSGIAGVTDWFNIFLVIGAMVVLILLTVIIITAIRGSGLLGGVEGTSRRSGKGGNIGSA